MQRRWFLLGLGSGALAACHPWARPKARPEQPGDHELETLEAIVETFLPAGDGMPGARDVGAVALIVDPAYGVNPWISEVVSDLDDWCMVQHGGKFFELDGEQREAALEERMGLRDRFVQSAYVAVYEGMLALTKLAYVGAPESRSSSRAGMYAIGFPGPSAGYAAASAAGAYPATDTPKRVEPGIRSQVAVTGAGNVAEVRVCAVVTSSDDLHATLQLVTPGGKTFDLAVRADDGRAVFEDVVAPVNGGPAAGTWRLDVLAVAGGTGQLEFWSLRVRTDLDG